MEIKDDKVRSRRPQVSTAFVINFFCDSSKTQPTFEAKPMSTPFTVTIGIRS
jgi:hypothetical protein